MSAAAAEAVAAVEAGGGVVGLGDAAEAKGEGVVGVEAGLAGGGAEVGLGDAPAPPAGFAGGVVVAQDAVGL